MKCCKCNKQKKLQRSYCKSCRAKYQSSYYQKNTKRCLEINKKANKKRSKLIAQKINKYLREHPCIDCGESDIIVLEFDHRKPKQKIGNIGNLVAWGFVWNYIFKEIKKCDVRCANCHRRKTAKQQNWYSRFY